MFAVIRGLGALIVLAGAAWGGYLWGGREVDRLKAELETIRQTGEAARQASESAQAAIRAEMAQLGQAHEEKLGQLNQQFEGDRQTLKDQLRRSEDQRSALNRQQQGYERDLAEIERQRESAPTITDADLKLQESLKTRQIELSASIQQIKRQKAGLECLQLPVPAEQVATLNRGLPAVKER
jgi:chromosome segregation ATPase